MIQPTRPGQEPNAQIQQALGGGIEVQLTRRVGIGEMMNAEFGDYYWLHCWHRLSIESVEESNNATTRIRESDSLW
jgi:hypothetical protein